MKLLDHVSGMVITSKDDNENETTIYKNFIIMALLFLENHRYDNKHNLGIRFTDKDISNIDVRELVQIVEGQKEITQAELEHYLSLLKENHHQISMLAQQTYCGPIKTYLDDPIFYHEGKLYTSDSYTYIVPKKNAECLLDVTAVYISMCIRRAINKLSPESEEEGVTVADVQDTPIVSEKINAQAALPPTFFVEEDEDLCTYRVLRPYRLGGLSKGEDSYYNLIDRCLINLIDLLDNVRPCFYSD